MECFFSEELDFGSEFIYLSESESKHTKSLRIKINDNLQISNGRGLIAEGILTEISKSKNKVQIMKFYPSMNEINQEITLAFGLLDNNERIDFLVEKAVELGVKEIAPVICSYSVTSTFRYDRTVSKAIAALKQCKRSFLPEITPPFMFDNLVTKLENWDVVLLADESGDKLCNITNKNKILILVGPEGGFSENEKDKILSNKNVSKLKLSNTRLRGETAAISALSVVIQELL